MTCGGGCPWHPVQGPEMLLYIPQRTGQPPQQAGLQEPSATAEKCCTNFSTTSAHLTCWLIHGKSFLLIFSIYSLPMSCPQLKRAVRMLHKSLSPNAGQERAVLCYCFIMSRPPLVFNRIRFPSLCSQGRVPLLPGRTAWRSVLKWHGDSLLCSTLFRRTWVDLNVSWHSYYNRWVVFQNCSRYYILNNV